MTNLDSWKYHPFINLPLKLGFLNFSSFPSFRFGFIVQNKNPESPEILFEKLSKTLPIYNISDFNNLNST